MSLGKSIVVVTGASRGIGAAICEQISNEVTAGSVIVGIARDVNKLQEVKEKVTQVDSDVTFTMMRQDLQNPDLAEFNEVLARAVETGQKSSEEVFKTAIMIHNAGSLGSINYAKTLDQFNDVKTYYDFNISSVVVLNSAFLQQVKTLQDSAPQLHVKVVNITSMCAKVPFKSWSLYCSGKAARDMFFKVLAAEETDIRVLCYAPGPVETDMLRTGEASSADDDMRSNITSLIQEGKALTPQQTVTKMIKLIIDDTFTSGDHVDYFDI